MDNVAKSIFAKNNLKYCDYVLGKDEIKVDSRKIEIMHKWAKSKDVN